MVSPFASVELLTRGELFLGYDGKNESIQRFNFALVVSYKVTLDTSVVSDKTVAFYIKPGFSSAKDLLKSPVLCLNTLFRRKWGLTCKV